MQCVSSENDYEMCVIDMCEMFQTPKAVVVSLTAHLSINPKGDIHTF